MAKQLKREAKKPYSKPIFVVYGTLRELREKAGVQGSGDCAK